MAAPSSQSDRNSPRGYSNLIAFARSIGIPIKDLIALAPANDPFYIGSPAHCRDAEWFTELWQRFGACSGMHVRRMHYQAFSRGVQLPDGSSYPNTNDSWDLMSKASKYARMLHLVPADDFVDRRNPDPHLYAASRETREPEVFISGPAMPSMPAIRLDNDLHLALPDPYLMGYDFRESDQPFLIELWCEKSTVDDVLAPLCQELGVNYVTSIGFQSITSEVTLLRRIREHGKPTRIFYVSDFDSAGSGMPRAVSRQLEFWFPDYLNQCADVKLTPLVLTRDQVDFYDLPNAPGSSKSVNDRFEREQNRGTVELDALEALHPGELARIVRDAVQPYRDETLRRRLLDAHVQARSVISDEWHAATAPLEEEIDRITGGIEEIAGRYASRTDALNDELQTELAPYHEAIAVVSHAVRTAVAAFDPELPERPEPETDDPDEDGWLFDSSRDYLEQLEYYQRQKGGGG